MIKHEEIKDRLKKAYSNNRYLNNITIFRFHDYITEQEKKDELLGLYKRLYETPCQESEIVKRIEELECELK